MKMGKGHSITCVSLALSIWLATDAETYLVEFDNQTQDTDYQVTMQTVAEGRFKFFLARNSIFTLPLRTKELPKGKNMLDGTRINVEQAVGPKKSLYFEYRGLASGPTTPDMAGPFYIKTWKNYPDSPEQEKQYFRFAQSHANGGQIGFRILPNGDPDFYGVKDVQVIHDELDTLDHGVTAPVEMPIEMPEITPVIFPEAEQATIVQEHPTPTVGILEPAAPMAPAPEPTGMPGAPTIIHPVLPPAPMAPAAQIPIVAHTAPLSAQPVVQAQPVQTGTKVVPVATPIVSSTEQSPAPNAGMPPAPAVPAATPVTPTPTTPSAIAQSIPTTPATATTQPAPSPIANPPAAVPPTPGAQTQVSSEPAQPAPAVMPTAPVAATAVKPQ